MKITVIIIAFDEEDNIDKVIDSARKVSGEIVVVVDSRSTDKTASKAAELGAKVYVRDFDNFSAQKNFATSKASGDWILSLDADEETTDELTQEIKQVVSENKYDGFLIPRRNFLLGREIKHTRWSPDKHIWLWKKEKGKWVGEIHEEVAVSGKVGELKNAKVHNSYKTVSDFLDMVNSYTELEAKRKVANGEHFSFFRMFFDAARSFFGRYFYKLGFLDGWQGFILSYLMGIYRVITWAKVWEKEK